MTGLDITVTSLSQLLEDNVHFRIDSEFNGKDYLQVQSFLKGIRSEKFESCDPEILHPKEITREYVDENGTWFFRAQNLRPLRVDDTDQVFISEVDTKTLSSNRISFGDILLTRTGANRGDCLYYDRQDSAISSSHTFIIRNQSWNQAFLAVYFNTDYGKLQIDKGVYGAVQPEIAPYYLKNIWIPKLSSKFQSEIEQLINAVTQKRTLSDSLLKDAHHRLLQELGLGNWRPVQPLTYTRRASDVFATARLDSEYHRPAAVELVNRLKISGSEMLSSCASVSSGFPWDSVYFIEGEKRGEPFVRIRDCKPGEIDLNELDRLESSYANSEGMEKAKLGDLVIGMDGLKWFYAGLINSPCYVNQRIAWVRPTDLSTFSPEYLMLVINSILGQTQLLREMTIAQTVGHITNDNVRELLIPLLTPSTRERLTMMVRKSINARREAKALIEKAKEAVNIAIRAGEQSAIEFLKKEM